MMRAFNIRREDLEVVFECLRESCIEVLGVELELWVEIIGKLVFIKYKEENVGRWFFLLLV